MNPNPKMKNPKPTLLPQRNPNPKMKNPNPTLPTEIETPLTLNPISKPIKNKLNL